MIRKAYQPTKVSIAERRDACQEEKGKNLSTKRGRVGKERPEMWITFRIFPNDLNKT